MFYGAGVFVSGTEVETTGTGVSVGGISVGGMDVGGTDVAEGGTGVEESSNVLVGGTDVFVEVGGTAVGVRVGGNGVEEGSCVWVGRFVAVEVGAIVSVGGCVGRDVGLSLIGFSRVAVG